MEGGGGCGRGPDPQAGPHLLQDDRRSYHPVPPSGIENRLNETANLFITYITIFEKKIFGRMQIRTGILLALFAITFVSPSANIYFVLPRKVSFSRFMVRESQNVHEQDRCEAFLKLVLKLTVSYEIKYRVTGEDYFIYIFLGKDKTGCVCM